MEETESISVVFGVVIFRCRFAGSNWSFLAGSAVTIRNRLIASVSTRESYGEVISRGPLSSCEYEEYSVLVQELALLGNVHIYRKATRLNADNDKCYLYAPARYVSVKEFKEVFAADGQVARRGIHMEQPHRCGY